MRRWLPRASGASAQAPATKMKSGHAEQPDQSPAEGWSPSVGLVPRDVRTLNLSQSLILSCSSSQNRQAITDTLVVVKRPETRWPSPQTSLLGHAPYSAHCTQKGAICAAPPKKKVLGTSTRACEQREPRGDDSVCIYGQSMHSVSLHNDHPYQELGWVCHRNQNTRCVDGPVPSIYSNKSPRLWETSLLLPCLANAMSSEVSSDRAAHLVLGLEGVVFVLCSEQLVLARADRCGVNVLPGFLESARARANVLSCG